MELKKPSKLNKEVPFGEGLLAMSLVAAGKQPKVAMKISAHMMKKWGEAEAKREDLRELLEDLKNAITDPGMYD